MPKKYSLHVLAIWFAVVTIVLLFGASFLDAVNVPLHLRERRQITYAKSNHNEDFPGKQKIKDEEEEELKYLEPITLRKPLPQHNIYPGDLSSFFAIKNTSKSKENSTTPTTLSFMEININRTKRGAYLRDSSETEATSTRSSPRKPLKSRFAESRRHETFQSVDVPSEMSFSGAGYLRSEDNGIHGPPPPPNNFPLVGNRRAEDDFQAAFHPEYGRDFEAVQFDDDIRPPGTIVNKKMNSASRSVLQKDSKLEMESPSTPQFSILPQKTLNGHMQPFLPTIPTQYSNMAGMNSFFYNSPFISSGQLATAADSTGFDIHESLLKNHRLNSGAPNNQVTVASTVEKQHIVSPKRDTIADLRKSQKGRKKRSTYPSQSQYQDIEYGSKEKVSETQHGYRYSRSDERHDSASGFIPLTGTFEGGSLHLSLPYYDRPMTPPYSSRTPMSYNSYGPRRPQSRHYGSGDNYFHPSEARRYSYGILGSGNFEVIRGGVYSGESPRGMGGMSFDDGRSSYGGEIFNNYGGTTEIIIDGPIQGFQGFDNFPAHLINALSKHSEIAIRGPER